MTDQRSVLEVLRDARDRLKGKGSWTFHDWSQCTCGHIYAAATGEEGGPIAVYHGLNGGDDLYVETLKATALALGWKPGFLIGWKPGYDGYATDQPESKQAAAFISD